VSQNNVERVREIYSRLALGDGEFFFASLDPEVEWDERDMPWPDAALYRGVSGVRDLFRRWLGAWDRFEWHPRDFVGLGDRVVVTVRQQGIGKGSGIQVDQTRAQVWTFRDGKVVAFRSFLEREHALRAAGFSK
jgi:ketosteroid isomerase-like protein